MPTLKQLLEELKELRVRSDELNLSGSLYDDLVSQAGELADEDLENEE